MNNLANILTVSRLLLLPFIILLFFFQAPWAVWTVLGLYVVGAVTDWLDGWVARRYDQVSEFGKFMDPISDKIFVVTMLLLLIAFDRIQGIFVLAVIVILVREFLVSGLREFLGPKEIKLPVTNLAKWKTTAQMVATGMLIVTPVSSFAYYGGHALLCAAAVLTAITGWGYMRAGWKYIRWH